MSSITHSLNNLLTSIFDIFRSLLNTLLSSVQSVGAVLTNLVRSVADLALSLFNFLLNNIVILGLIAAAFVGYSVYRQRHGQDTVSRKKVT
ncbi:MAG: hypothetical protein M1833_004342 [Piccolia ochrophora]|nr:MAG: hypothetical protein M1833_004342 [Piccolia ochrophora]